MTQERVKRVVKVVEEMKKLSWDLYEIFKADGDEIMAKKEFAEWDACYHFLRMLEDKEYLETMENIYLGVKEN